eukprot:NODE_350_length_1862_cov_101.312190_g293_i0.p1 GENE.NODE_350_length_1862_cov_101.312190_g293_i0~~NODE_350_length_1862_cov_101.312190_g293_i0.p1  ORF type:complete len:266 (+),score=68.83 NODE_350_length_1862_cov_101.312190_g293_i0:1-798(+)
MLIFAMMIGLITDSISDRLESLKEGKATVVESGHILILGWSDKIYRLLSELALAEESDGGNRIVILAEKPKQEMETLISEAQVELLKSNVIVREGTPSTVHNLNHVSAAEAKCVIVLSPSECSPDEADGWCLRVVLCLRKLGYKRGHAVVELRDIDNRELLMLAGGDLVEPIVAHDFIGRLIIQSGRQPGLAQVLESLLGFRGDEFYMKEWPELVNTTFSELMFRFPAAVPLGVMRDDGMLLNPDNDYRIQPGEKIIVLAADDDT